MEVNEREVFVDYFGERVAQIAEREGRMMGIMNGGWDDLNHFDVWFVFATLCGKNVYAEKKDGGSTNNAPRDWYASQFVPDTYPNWKLEIVCDSDDVEFNIVMRPGVIHILKANGYILNNIVGRILATSVEKEDIHYNIPGIQSFRDFCNYVKKTFGLYSSPSEIRLTPLINAVQFRRALYIMHQNKTVIFVKIQLDSGHVFDFFPHEIQELLKSHDVKTLFNLALAGDRTAASISASNIAWKWMFERDYPNEYEYFRGRVHPLFETQKYLQPWHVKNNVAKQYYDPPWKRMYLRVRLIYKSLFKDLLPPGAEDDNILKRAAVTTMPHYVVKNVCKMIFMYYMNKLEGLYEDLKTHDTREYHEKRFLNYYLNIEMKNDIGEMRDDVIVRVQKDMQYREKYDFFLMVYVTTTFTRRFGIRYHELLIAHGLESYTSMWTEDDAPFLAHMTHILKTKSLLAPHSDVLQKRQCVLFLSVPSILKNILKLIKRADIFADKEMSWRNITEIVIPAFTPQIASSLFPFAACWKTGLTVLREHFIKLCILELRACAVAPRDKTTGVLILSCISCATPNPQFTCSNCKDVHYCNVECQKQHWINGHSIQCTVPQ